MPAYSCKIVWNFLVARRKRAEANQRFNLHRVARLSERSLSRELIAFRQGQPGDFATQTETLTGPRKRAEALKNLEILLS